MSQCSQCYSYAINPWHSGRDRKSDVDLCDVCYWRKRADELSDAKAERARYGDTMTSKMGKLEAEIATLREWALNALGWLEWEVDTDNTSEVLAAVRDGEELIKSGRLMLSSRAALDAKEV